MRGVEFCSFNSFGCFFIIIPSDNFVQTFSVASEAFWLGYLMFVGFHFCYFEVVGNQVL